MGIDQNKPVEDSPVAGKSCLVKLLLGCGCLTLVGGLVTAIAVACLVYFAMSTAEDFAKSYEEQGYLRRDGQVVKETDRVEEPTVYVAQLVELQSGARDHVALVCQVAKIDGEVDGDLAFLGQSLEIAPGAVIRGNIDVKAAQVVTLHGEVEGNVSFFGQVLTVTRRGIVRGDVDAEGAQTVNVQGTVEGRVKGDYQVLHRRPAATGAVEKAEEVDAIVEMEEAADVVESPESSNESCQ